MQEGIGGLRERQNKLQGREAELNTLLISQEAEPATQEEVVECAYKLKELLEEGSIAERKAFIQSFVSEVRITGGEALLTYTIPQSTNKMHEQASVLGIVHYGGR